MAHSIAEPLLYQVCFFPGNKMQLKTALCLRKRQLSALYEIKLSKGLHA
ncbi:MAG: hypothetical protein ACI832_003513 [Rheinheimera aquimaris]|jgi:hypothetical protein